MQSFWYCLWDSYTLREFLEQLWAQPDALLVQGTEHVDARQLIRGELLMAAGGPVAGNKPRVEPRSKFGRGKAGGFAELIAGHA